MKITASQLSFSAERKYEEQRISKQSVETLEDRISLAPRPSENREQSEITGLKLNIGKRPRLFSSITEVPAPDPQEQINGDPRLAAMKRMIESMTGKKIRLTDISGFTRDDTSSPATSSAPSLNFRTPSLRENGNISFMEQKKADLSSVLSKPFELPEIPVRRVRVTQFNSLYESESTNFQAQGTVRNSAGEEINFSLNLEMKREFYKEESLQIMGDAVLTDPLVINFGGSPADLTDVRFKFDLNSDGEEEEEIPWLTSGSGFLVLDKNRDGVVNNGSELFGPRTNNGFGELSQLDEDKNGWIDENDSAFEELSIWSGESPETAELKSLKERGIGAIAVSSAETLFSIKDQDNATLGQIRRTGIYLGENGKAGTIQQLDLSV